MIKELIRLIFPVRQSSTQDPSTERIVNIVWTKEDWWKEGYDTNSVFRVKSKKHELELLEKSEFVIETAAAIASPLTCPLNKFHHEHGCYSADFSYLHDLQRIHGQRFERLGEAEKIYIMQTLLQVFLENQITRCGVRATGKAMVYVDSISPDIRELLTLDEQMWVGVTLMEQIREDYWASEALKEEQL